MEQTRRHIENRQQDDDWKTRDTESGQHLVTNVDSSLDLSRRVKGECDMSLPTSLFSSFMYISCVSSDRLTNLIAYSQRHILVHRCA